MIDKWCIKKINAHKLFWSQRESFLNKQAQNMCILNSTFQHWEKFKFGGILLAPLYSIREWMTQTATKLKYTNNKRLNWISRQPQFEYFSSLQGNKLWKAQPNQDSPTATAGLKEKRNNSGQKNPAANFILKKSGYKPQNIFSSPAVSGIYQFVWDS